ncbi:mutS [Ecytonucleospora hepatopenaei]|uniref:MutS n=1 Tax=Ecytonucleospora hepatopenaei TaxID=646526 RepID=A0A1W0E672_9MICR|nr:mutS [Ecytonucleospora hepatopenaei]
MSKILSYDDLDSSIFKYFVDGEDVYVYKTDIQFLPSDFITSDKKIEFRTDKLEVIVKQILETKNCTVHEYQVLNNEIFEKEDNKEHSSFKPTFSENKNTDYIVSINHLNFKLRKTGNSKNYNDFSDLFESLPTVCSVEFFNNQTYAKLKHKMHKTNIKYTHVFAYTKKNTIYYTFYQDDDLLSTTYSLISIYNCVEVLYSSINFKRVFENWGISCVHVSKSDMLLETYFNSNLDKKYFQINEFCLVDINDFDLVDFGCATKQGQRLLMTWLKSPLVNKKDIEMRLNHVEYFKDVKISLTKFIDLKRLIFRIENKSISVDEMITLYEVIKVIPYLIQKIKNGNSTILPSLSNEIIEPLEVAYEELNFVSDLIYEKIDVTAGELYLENNQSYLVLVKSKIFIENEIEKELRSVKKIFPNAKLQGDVFKVTRKEFGNNKTFKAINLSKTGVSFTTKNIKELNQQLEIVKTKIYFETQIILEDIKEKLIKCVTSFEIYNFLIALVDIYKTLSFKVITPGYSRPILFEKEHLYDNSYKIKEMWHPMMENNVVKNDIEFDKKMVILTGPNMGGKSTFIKTVSIISLYAQIGCYVPAKYASLPIFERIVMRVGARDVCSQHMSTFMVEMVDLNILCRNEKFGLVLVDELGRGTSAIDGVSIIKAVQRYLIKKNNFTIITTHFNLNEDNNTKVKEIKMGTDTNGVFTFRVENGKTDGSFAIKVAQMANFPHEVIQNAEKYLKND